MKNEQVCKMSEEAFPMQELLPDEHRGDKQGVVFWLYIRPMQFSQPTPF